MSALRGLFAGVGGAAAYNAYKESDGLSSSSIASGLYEAFQRKGAAGMAEAARMQKQVDELQSALIKSLRERGQPTVIVKDSGRSGNTLVGVVVVVGGVALYLRFIKGWRLADMMYVTKGALVNMQQSVNTSLATVRGQVEAATNDMLARLGVVSAKADDMLGRQEAMDARLTDVGDRVEGVQGGVALLQDQVAYSNHAVTMLCGAMSEVAKRVGLNGRYVQSLDTLVHGAPPTLGSGRPQQQARVGGVGVRTLLQAPAGDGDVFVNPAAESPFVGGEWGPAASMSGAPRPNPAVFALNGSDGAVSAARAASTPAGSSSSFGGSRVPGGGGALAAGCPVWGA